jgi:hypothetical protein
MPRSARPLQPTAAYLMALALAIVAGPAAATNPSTPRLIPPSTAVMTLPEALGAMERPAVEFPHAAHTSALEAEGCTACHLVEEVGLIPEFTPVRGVTDRDQLIDKVHDACLSCHRSRTSAAGKHGPLECGECHVRRAPGVSERAAMTWDYSLHGRHAQAFPDKCETCHHSYDEAEKKLVYVKGTEEACRTCHLDRDDGKKLSLRNAVHTDCVGCHLRRVKSGQTAGPTLCVGCHDAKVVSAYPQLDPVPRLLRGQPDRGWISTEGTRSPMVVFNHLGHEPDTSFCSGCHHQSLRPCHDCHTLSGSAEGAGFTLAESYHAASSGYSCVGCHSARTRATECVGCHRSIPTGASQTTCVRCHVGPPRLALRPDELPPLPAAVKIQLPPLPAASDAFPEEVVISVLAKDYEPAKLPHRKIVAKLDEGIRASSLAASFHATTVRMCEGCHHHAPEGQATAQCGACHGEEAVASLDRPGLKVAYHRQCIGCHQAMGIKKQGCTDCHAAKEVQP